MCLKHFSKGKKIYKRPTYNDSNIRKRSTPLRYAAR